MKKPYHSIIIFFYLFTFSPLTSANYDQDKYISYFKSKLTRISNIALKPLNIKAGLEQVVIIEVMKDGSLFRTDTKKPIKNKNFSKSIKRLIILAAPFRRFPKSFKNNIKLSKIKITFAINDSNKIIVKNIKLIELKNVLH